MAPRQNALMRHKLIESRWRRWSEYGNFMWLPYSSNPTWDDMHVFTPEPTEVTP